MPMKKIFPFMGRWKRENVVVGSLLIFTIFSILLFSCQKEPSSTEELKKETSDPLVLAAKAWFEQTYATTADGADSLILPMNAKGEKKKSIKAKPEWNAAYVGRDSVVEVPLTSLGKLGYARGQQQPSKAVLDAVETRMLILKDEQGAYYHAFMNIVPDSAYLEKHHYKVKNNAYKNMPKDFSGMVFYVLPDGRFCNGWQYREGKITHSISSNSTLEVPTVNVKRASYSEDCTLYVITEYTINCTITVGRPGMVCGSWYISGIEYWLVCPADNPDPTRDPDGNLYNPWGAGGAQVPQYTVTLTANPLIGGTVTGGGKYPAGNTLIIAASALSGYLFVSWTSNGTIVSIEPSYSFTVTDDQTFIARFAHNNICGQVEKIATNAQFKNKMSELQGNINLANETGYTWDGNSYSPLTGTGNCIIGNIPLSGTLDGLMHVHTTNCMSIFSATDLMAMYQILATNHMTSATNFTMSLVTPNGTNYILKIEDEAKFRAFGNAWFVGVPNNDYLEATFHSFYQIGTNNTPDANERAFLQMLQQANTGLKLFKSNSSDYTPYGVDTNNNPIIKPC